MLGLSSITFNALNNFQSMENNIKEGSPPPKKKHVQSILMSLMIITRSSLIKRGKDNGGGGRKLISGQTNTDTSLFRNSALSTDSIASRRS